MGKKDDDFHLNFGLGGLFRGLSNFMDLVSQMAEKGETEITRTGEILGTSSKLHGIYGFSARIGLGGKPIIEKFGNIRLDDSGPCLDEIREPIIDVFDEKDKLLVIAELPGIEEESIKVYLENNSLHIYGAGKNRIYEKKVQLPSPVVQDSQLVSYRNGILEVELNKETNE